MRLPEEFSLHPHPFPTFHYANKNHIKIAVLSLTVHLCCSTYRTQSKRSITKENNSTVSDKMQISYIMVIFQSFSLVEFGNMNIEVKKTVNAEETKLNADNTKQNNRRE
ncbi:hypothetical protein T03_15871, partial [Trichinella britovi]